jgi:hypothetical protein
MGFILIIIGIIIQRQLYVTNPDNFHQDYISNASMFMLDPIVRLVLLILSWGLIIGGIVMLFN